MMPGAAGFTDTVMHLAALVDDPPHELAAVTHSWAVVNPDGKVTCTFGVPCPLVMGAAEPPRVQL